MAFTCAYNQISLRIFHKFIFSKLLKIKFSDTLGRGQCSPQVPASASRPPSAKEVFPASDVTLSHCSPQISKYLFIPATRCSDILIFLTREIFWYLKSLSRCEAVLAACQSYLLSTPGWIFKIHTDPCFIIDLISFTFASFKSHLPVRILNSEFSRFLLAV